jgi:hypothetical protein
LTSKEISRHKGIFAVEAITNVEIEEVDAKNLAPLDISEVHNQQVSQHF